MTILNIAEVKVDNRIRKDMGNIDELADSIRTVGLIQPIVLTRNNDLIAGERRLRALRKLGVGDLVHEVHFVFNDELDDLKLKAMEIEENVKRKELSWQEQVLAKKKLLETLIQIHGPSSTGRPTHSDIIGATTPGFGVNKLASLLNESNATTSRDLELAHLITSVPHLAKAETKEAARRQAQLGLSVATSLIQTAKNPPKSDKKWELYEGDFNATAPNLASDSVDLVLVDPPYGEDTQALGPNSKQLLATPFSDGRAETVQLLHSLAGVAYRVLRNDRFAGIFFGFKLYSDVITAFRLAGFDVDYTPLIWVKNTVINTSPYTRYGRSYEPILICRKGEPKLARPSQRDVIQVQTVITRGTQEQKFYHAQKPVELMEKLVYDLSLPQSTVVDFCAGSGSTGVAALRAGRRVTLFEKDPAACAIIKARLGALK
jgi:ParB family transcriptional regulator, chromosome partitioning protein